jgi:hypothetical protein
MFKKIKQLATKPNCLNANFAFAFYKKMTNAFNIYGML